jgi:proline iminopeptidase
MRDLPTVVLLHGGPGSYDHSYFKPHFARLTGRAQVVYLDLRDHGRSQRHRPTDWTFEACADDVRAFCDAIGIVRPIVAGHSMGGCVAMLYGIRHPAHASALMFLSTFARLDLDRLTDGFRHVAGDRVADLARQDFGGRPVTDEQWSEVFAAFGPTVPTADELARRIGNPEVGEHGMELLRRFDVVEDLARVASRTLVCVGTLDPVTPLAAAEEIVDALPAGLARLHVVNNAGHFPWLDNPADFWGTIIDFVGPPTAADGRGARGRDQVTPEG